MKVRVGGWAAATLGLVLCSACSAQKPTATPANAQKPTALSFDWRPPAAAEVIHEHEKNLTRVTTRFVLRACPAGDLMSVRAIDHEIQSVGDVKASSIKPDELAEVNALARATPTFLVSKNGQVYDVVGMEKAIKATLVRMREQGKDPAIVARLEKSFASPLMTQQIKEKYSELWYVWVGSWLDVNLKKKSDSQEMTIFLGGKDLVVPTDFRVKSVTKDRVEVSLESVLEGPEASRALSNVIRAMVSLPKSANERLEQLRLRRVYAATLVTEPETMRPALVQSTMRITVQGQGPTKRRAEGDRYTFSWLPAAKAKALCAQASP